MVDVVRAIVISGYLDDVACPCRGSCLCEVPQGMGEILGQPFGLGEDSEGCIQKPEPLVGDPDLVT